MRAPASPRYLYTTINIVLPGSLQRIASGSARWDPGFLRYVFPSGRAVSARGVRLPLPVG